jgi:hypothetical protein
MRRAEPENEDRLMTVQEQRLVRWMLQNGTPEARAFLSQAKRAKVTPRRCLCGCATMEFVIEGHPVTTGIGRLLGDYLFEDEERRLCGIFVYEQHGVLGGVEVYGMEGDAPWSLPEPEQLRPFKS